MSPRVLLFFLILTFDVYAQQIGEINLVRPTQETQKIMAPDVGLDGCDSPRYTHSDGVIVNTERKSKLQLELTLPKRTFHPGEIVDSQVVLRNVGMDALVIPWSVDPQVAKRPGNVTQHEYEIGSFELELRGAGKMRIPLESESESNFLYSSELNSTSGLRVEPGQWITAKFRFVMEQKRILSVILPMKAGKMEISVQWRQTRHTWKRDGCSVQAGYYNYEYQTDAKPIGIEME